MHDFPYNPCENCREDITAGPVVHFGKRTTITGAIDGVVMECRPELSFANSRESPRRRN